VLTARASHSEIQQQCLLSWVSQVIDNATCVNDHDDDKHNDAIANAGDKQIN
jgi:hypothetical protein